VGINADKLSTQHPFLSKFSYINAFETDAEAVAQLNLIHQSHFNRELIRKSQTAIQRPIIKR